jgi:hypothetical protein
VQHVVADPAEERAVLPQAQPARLGLQFRLVRAAAGDQEADVSDPLDHARQRVQRQLEALLVDQPADQQHELLVRLGELARSACRSPVGRRSLGSTPLGITVTRSSSMSKMSATCPRM